MPGNVIARELIPFGGGWGGTLQQFAWPEALQSFLFALQWTIVTNVTIYHHLISQAGWNRCNLYIYLSIYLSPALLLGLASRVTLAVRADARDVLSIYFSSTWYY